MKTASRSLSCNIGTARSAPGGLPNPAERRRIWRSTASRCGLSLILLLILLLLAGCEEQAAAPTPTPGAGVPSEPGRAGTGRLSVLGTISPAQRLDLSFQVGGPVQAVTVQVGTEVKAGDLLAELDTLDLEMAVQEAEDGLALRLAMLDQASAGAREQELVITQAEYQRALAQHELLVAGAHPEEVAMAQADYRAALARYDQVESGADQEELSVARSSVEKAEVALQSAQAAYDRIAWRPDVTASPQAVALHEATIDYQVAKAQYERLTKLPTTADLQEAKAQMARSQAQLRLAQAGPAEQEVAASASGVAIARAQVALKEAGPRPEDVAVAEAQVRQARTALARATQALSQAQLLAPFDGTVSAVYRSPGEWAGAGAPVVELLDTSRWWVETRNVGELNIGRVRVGQEALVRVIAYRDQEVRGRVSAISPVAVVQQGDTTYTVQIDLEPTELDLRPGMNAEVEVMLR